jgi:hypothetical protein
MAGIDFTKDALRLAYLVEMSVFLDDKEQTVRLCGPRDRVGSGLVADIGDGDRQWEARLSRAQFSATIGTLKQSVQTVSDLSFFVSTGLAGSDAEILELVRDGRWANRRARLYLYDLNTGTAQPLVEGFVDRDPDKWTPSGFSITVAAGIFPLDQLLPMSQIPVNTDEFTAPDSGAFTQDQYPRAFHLNPDHLGKWIGPVVGDDPSDDGVWKEVAPYGGGGQFQFFDGVLGRQFLFCHVSHKTGLFVHRVAFEAGAEVFIRGFADGLFTFENDDITEGPIGTNLRVDINGEQFGLVDQSNDLTGARPRIFARVSGWELGEYDPLGPGTPPESTDTGQVVENVWEVLDDLFSLPEFLGLSSVWGSGALTDFENEIPAAAADWHKGLCAIPLDIVDAPPTMREVLEGIMLALPADIVQRFDPISDELRIYPIWREPRPGSTADHVLSREDFHTGSRSALPQFRVDSDPSRYYGNQTTVKGPTFYSEPQSMATPFNDDVDQLVIPVNSVQFQEDATEASEPRNNGPQVTKYEYEYWRQPGDGAESTAQFISHSQSQPQRVITAVLGISGFRILLGESVRYAVPLFNLPTAIGMVRKIAYNLDAQTVTIESYHTSQYGT